MFIPQKIFFEADVKNYELGKFLLEKYKDVPMYQIESHNAIPEMRNQPNSEFGHMKQNLIIGIRKTHKFVPNYKVSNFLVPYTSSGCSAMCLYCYLVCNYNKCSYLRIFVNREEMLKKIIKISNGKNLTFEIGSNSDLILENTITSNLPWTIENFAKYGDGHITFPTKFDMVDPILNLKHNNKVIVRMSINPEKIIREIEFGTSPLQNRIEAINKLDEAGYKIGILIAPVILVDNWEKLYTELFQTLSEKLNESVKSKVFFEVILMTYSYIHRAINKDAFPNAVELYNSELMTGRGRGKYCYRPEVREKAENKIRELIKRYFSTNEIIYFS